eukprot:Gb_33336 [translate_table: standard]
MLPSDVGKYTLVLDMDGTLLIELTRRYSIPVDFTLRHSLTGKRTFISKRSGAEKLLETAAKYFEIVIFTESMKKRADAILDMLENSSCIRHRLYRDSCSQIDGKLVKDLSRLGRDLRKVIIIDDCPFCYILQPDNAIGASCFQGHILDNQLHLIRKYLEKLVTNLITQEKDVRGMIEDKFVNNIPPNIVRGPLLPPMLACDEGKYTLVLDMDRTLLRELRTKKDQGSQCFPYKWSSGNVSFVYKRPDAE